LVNTKKINKLILGCPRPKICFSGLPLNPSRHQAGRTFHLSPSLRRTVAKRKKRWSWSIQKNKKKKILGCPRPKFFFSGLPNLLPQKIRLPLISFFSRVSYIWGITSREAPQKIKLPLISFFSGVSYI
jgi:hypothetical protein